MTFAAESRLGAKGTARTAIFAPDAVWIVGLDGELEGLTAEDRARIEAMPEIERPPALAPFRIAWLKKQLGEDANAVALVDALVEDRATLPLDANFLVSCTNGVHQPIVVTSLGEVGGKPIVAVVEGRQRVRALRVHNARRASEDPPMPPLAVNAVVRTLSPRRAKEVVIVTSNHVALTSLQRAQRAKSLLDDGVAPADVAPIVGATSVGALKVLLSVLDADASVQQAVAAGHITATAARDMVRLTRDEQKARVALIATAGAKGGRARGIALTGVVKEEPAFRPPPRKVVESAASRLRDSKDPLQRIAGAVLTWATSGATAGCDRVPGLLQVIEDELGRSHGEPLSADERAALEQYISSKGSVGAAAAFIGVNQVTLANATTGGRVIERVRKAIRDVAMPRPSRRRTRGSKAPGIPTSPLTDNEVAALKEFVRTCGSKRAAAERIGINYLTLDRILDLDVAPLQEGTAAKVRAVLPKAAA